MTFYFETFEYVADNGNILRVSRYRDKFAPRDFWRVCFSYKSAPALGYVLRDGLLNKPNSRQIARYLESI